MKVRNRMALKARGKVGLGSGYNSSCVGMGFTEMIGFNNGRACVDTHPYRCLIVLFIRTYVRQAFGSRGAESAS